MTALVTDRVGPNLVALVFQIKFTSFEHFTPPPSSLKHGVGVEVLFIFLTFTRMPKSAWVSLGLAQDVHDGLAYSSMMLLRET